MHATPFRLQLPPDASDARRKAQARYEETVNAMAGPITMTAFQYLAALADHELALADYGAVLLAADKERRPEMYQRGARPRISQSRDIGLMICLRLENQPVAIHEFDEDGASVVATDHIALVDVSDIDHPIIMTDSGARFRVSIIREG